MQKSTSTSGRRLAAAMFLGAGCAALAAGAAHADGGVTKAKVDGSLDDGTVAMTDGGGHTLELNTALISLKAPGSTTDLETYCIQRTVLLDPTQLYDEKDWASEADRIGIKPDHLQGIKWILNNSFPQISSADLAKAATAAGQPVSNLSNEEAVEATQAAIWAMAEPTGTLTVDQQRQHQHDQDDNVLKLFTYLKEAAGHHMGGSDTPQASLDVVPLQTTKPHPGDKVGFKLVSSDTTEAFISVSLKNNASGAKLVDAAGTAIPSTAKLKAGTTVYVQLPTSPDTGTVTLDASGIVNGIQAGRVFVNEGTKASQNLILAQASNVPVEATANVSWAAVVTPPPSSPSSTPSTTPSSHPSSTPSSTPSSSPSTTPSTPASTTSTTAATTPSSTPTTSATTSTPDTGLAHTGAGNTMAIGAGALALVAAGGGMVVYTRRRKGGQQGSHS